MLKERLSQCLVARGRRASERFAAAGGPIQIIHRRCELAVGQIDPLPVDAIVEVVAVGEGRLHDLAAEELVNQQCRDIALTARGVAGKPFSAALQGPGVPQRGRYTIRRKGHGIVLAINQPAS